MFNLQHIIKIYYRSRVSRTASNISLVDARVLIPCILNGERFVFFNAVNENKLPSFRVICTDPSRFAISNTLANFCLAWE